MANLNISKDRIIKTFSNELIPNEYFTADATTKSEILEERFNLIVTIANKIVNNQLNAMDVIEKMLEMTIIKNEDEEEYENCIFLRDLLKYSLQQNKEDTTQMGNE